MLKNALRVLPQASSLLSHKPMIQSIKLVSPVQLQISRNYSSLDVSLWSLKCANSAIIHRHSSSVATQEKQPVPDKLYSKIVCELRGNDSEVMKSYSIYATTAAKHLNIEVGKCWAQKKAHHERYTLLRSVHVVKRCRVQYEVRTWFRWIEFHKLTGSTADTFLEYIQRNLPEGVGLKVTKYELQRLPSHFVPPTVAEATASSDSLSVEAN